MDERHILTRTPVPTLKGILKRLNVLYAGWCSTCRKEVPVCPKSEIRKKKGMTHKSAKQKGRRAQQLAAKILQDTLMLSPEDVESIGMGQKGQDLRMTDRAREAWPFHATEITSRTNVSVTAKFAQAQRHAQKQIDGKVPGNGKPILLFKRNGTPLYAMVLLTDLAEVIAELQRK